MRAMAENADSARLSGVWVRRTSTVAWTVAGVLSAFTAILASPGQTSSLTEVLSPELLLLALTAAMVGAMVNLTVAFVAAIGVGVIQEILVWNLTSTAQVDLVLFALVMAVLLVRIAALQTGARREERSNWLEGTRTQAGHDSPAAARVGGRRRGCRRGGGRPPAPGGQHRRSFLLSQICIYAVIALSLTVLTGWAGQVSLGPVRAGGRGGPDGRPPRDQRAPWCSCSFGRGGDRGDRRPGGAARPAGARASTWP